MVIIDPSEQYTTHSGSNTDFFCNSPFNDISSVQWKMNDTLLDVLNISIRYSTSFNDVTRFGRLALENISYLLNNTFLRCTAIFMDGNVAHSETCKIIVQGKFVVMYNTYY